MKLAKFLFGLLFFPNVSWFELAAISFVLGVARAMREDFNLLVVMLFVFVCCLVIAFIGATGAAMATYLRDRT